jgi:hypothetical protein
MPIALKKFLTVCKNRHADDYYDFEKKYFLLVIKITLLSS